MRFFGSPVQIERYTLLEQIMVYSCFYGCFHPLSLFFGFVSGLFVANG